MIHRMSRQLLPGPHTDERPHRRRPQKCWFL